MLFRTSILALGVVWLSSVTAVASFAQNEQPGSSTTVEETTSNQQPLPDPANADLVIQGTVTAESLKYDRVPNTKIRFFGTPERVTGWRTERRNVPQDVKSGVTYRDIGVRFEIISVFENLDDPLNQPTAVEERLAPDTRLSP